MINWQSILSSFDDKPTLLEWLKKVQKALNESALTTVTVTQEKADRVNSITLSFNFQDGTKIVAPAFTVQDGADGVDGVGITDITNTVLSAGKISVTYDTTDGITVFADMQQDYTGGRHVSKVIYAVPLMPGNGIVIDKKANAEEVVVKIDTSLVALKSELAPKIYKHLLRCSEHGNANQYNITVYSSKSDAITTEYVLANDTCLTGTISAVLNNNTGAVTFDRLIISTSQGPEGYFIISAGGATPSVAAIKIESDSFEPL